MRMLYLMMALLGLFLCGYGVHCVLHFREFIGTDSYWTNPWFYKASAVLFGVIALRTAMGWVKERITNGKSKIAPE